jgi:hypothetical protein
MKHILTSLLMAVGITAGPFVAHLGAQENRMVAEIPFAFVASSKTLPAGTYNVTEIKGGSPIFQLTDGNRHSIFAQFGRNEAGKPENPSLTFVCYGKECVLAKVTPPNSPSAFGLSEKYIEKQLTHKVGMASMISVKLKAH